VRWLAFLCACDAGGAALTNKPHSPIDRDGWYVTIGPLGAATLVGGDWVSAVGGELSVVRLRQDHVPALLGLDLGGASYGGKPGGRLWLEAEAALTHPLPFTIGFGLGAAVEVDRVVPPRPGVQGTLWIFAGVIPYVRAGYIETTGAYAELGVLFKVPVRFAY
jgi:hypothetical protein